MRRLVSSCLLLVSLLLSRPVGAEPYGVSLAPDPDYLRAKAFQDGRRLAAAERLFALVAAAADPALTAPEPALPPESALPGALWVALLSPSGERLALRGQAPLELAARPVVQHALAASLRDDLIASDRGPVYVAAAPVAQGGRVAGVLLAGWPEAAWRQRLADESCGCRALLFMDGKPVDGDPSFQDAAVQGLEKNPNPLVPYDTPSGRVALVPLAGELSGAVYVLLFPPLASGAAPLTPALVYRNGPDPIILGGFLFGTALLSGALLFLARALSSRAAAASQDKLSSRLPSLFDEFSAAKVRCGEDISELHPDRFAAKVRETFREFATRAGTDQLALRVVVKQSRAQVVITPAGEVF